MTHLCPTTVNRALYLLQLVRLFIPLSLYSYHLLCLHRPNTHAVWKLRGPKDKEGNLALGQAAVIVDVESSELTNVL